MLLNAGAGDIVPGEYAVIYLCNIVPSLIVKLTGPYWFHHLTYKQRIVAASVCVSLCYILVNHVEAKGVRLLGVALGALQGGLGEATMLAMSQFYRNPKQCLSYFASGTGAAGPFGYILSLFVLPALTINSATFYLKNICSTIIGQLVVASYLGTFFLILEQPWVDQIREAKQRDLFKSIGDENEADDLPPTSPEDNNMEDPLLIEDKSGSFGSENSFRRVKSVADTLSTKERFRFITSLWPYMVPLFVVYVSEYAMQSGVWTAFALPSSRSQVSTRVLDKSYRDRAYKILNFTYQLGVFVSRSSGLLFQPNVATLWLMPIMQCGLWIFFYAIAIQHFMYGYVLLLPAFVTGLLGGAVYVNAFTLIDKNLVMVQTDQIKVAGGCRLTIRAAQFSKLPADFVLDLTTSDQQSG